LCNDLTVAFWLFPAAVIRVSQPIYSRTESEEIQDPADEVREHIRVNSHAQELIYFGY